MNLSSSPTLRIGVLALALGGAAQAEPIAIQLGAKVVIVGGAADDVLHVEGLGAIGAVEVRVGANATSIGKFFGVRDIVLTTGAGNDAVDVSGVEVGGSLKANLGAGADFIRFDHVLNDGVTEHALFFGGRVDVALGDQLGDFCRFEANGSAGQQIIVGGNLSVRGPNDVSFVGVGTTSGTDGQEILIGGNVSIRSKQICDVLLDDMNVGGKTKIEFGDKGAAVHFSDSHFARSLNVKLGGGGDSVVFASHVECNADVTLDGGGGVDLLLNFANTEIAGHASVKKFEIN